MDPDEVRAGQRATWAGLAVGWERWDDVIVDQLAPVATAMIDALDVGPESHHLDVASGTGEPGLTIARLAPAGRVVLTDLAEEMLAVALRRADAMGTGNVEVQVCSADDLPFDDGSFDSTSVRFGLMFFPDIGAALAELVRVLKPGGRFAASVWIDPTANPWTTIAMEAIASEVELPAPAPDGPGMYRCAAPGQVADLCRAAGLVDIDERDVAVDLVTATPEEYWQMISEHVSLAVAALDRATPDQRARIAARAIEAVAPYVRDDGVHVPGMARCTSGAKPAVPA
ncbi:MAG: class I SAM-dependent methyltransferase [Acidimicrobiales bacterium]